jgi:hypothetical protein
MPRVLYAAAPWWSGTWHRFRVINHIAAFAKSAGYRAHFLWCPSQGVSHCRFEELLSPVADIQVVNVSEREVNDLERLAAKSKTVRIKGLDLAVYRKGGTPADKMFAFDLGAAEPLENLARSRAFVTSPLRATPSPQILKHAAAYVRDQNLPRRVGIRVRVTECPIDGRKPRRIQKELDETVKSIIRIPWHFRVFVVTDSEYMQQMLASHFRDVRYLPKRFSERGEGGGYVDRNDQADMQTYMMEVECLMSCWRIVNVGGFINQDLMWSKILKPPYDRALHGTRPLFVNSAAR